MAIKANAIAESDIPVLKSMLLDRFRKNQDTGCWDWTGCLNEHGYGILRHRGAIVRGHRISHAAFVGPVLAGDLVLHSCDNPSCVNPDHLRVGTQAENMADAAERQRMERIPAKVVREIRRRRLSGEPYRQIADDLGLSKGYTRLIATGKARGDVSGPTAPVRATLSDADVREIRKDQANGARTSATAKKFNITVQHVSRLANGSTRPEAGGPFTTRPNGVHHERYRNG